MALTRMALTSPEMHSGTELTSQSLLERVIVRLAREEDLPRMEWDGQLIHFRRLYANTFRSYQRGLSLMWIAELPGVELLGQMFVQLASARVQLADGENRAYIYGFRIKPAYRRKGLGTYMMEFVEAYLHKRGFEKVTLNVGQHNKGALRLYKRIGYRVVAEEPGRWSYIDHMGRRRQVHEPSWTMEKDLDRN